MLSRSIFRALFVGLVLVLIWVWTTQPFVQWLLEFPTMAFAATYFFGLWAENRFRGSAPDDYSPRQIKVAGYATILVLALIWALVKYDLDVFNCAANVLLSYFASLAAAFIRKRMQNPKETRPTATARFMGVGAVSAFLLAKVHPADSFWWPVLPLVLALVIGVEFTRWDMRDRTPFFLNGLVMLIVVAVAGYIYGALYQAPLRITVACVFLAAVGWFIEDARVGKPTTEVIRITN